MLDFIVMLLVTGIAMALFSTVVVTIYTYLEEDSKKKEIRKYARQQIIKQMVNDEQLDTKMPEIVDLLKEYR
jgi:Na+-translocating ferredoxin:NAD+ oxidoreductase RnfG subunit